MSASAGVFGLAPSRPAHNFFRSAGVPTRSGNLRQESRHCTNRLSRLGAFLSSFLTIRVFRILLFSLAALLSGCTTPPVAPPPISARQPFNFQRDTFAYANQLVWDYYYDDHGKWVSKPHDPKPDYTHHCFVVVRSARQFFEHARFDPSQPIADTNTYRQLIHRVLASSPKREFPDARKVVIPGYADLRDFSRAQEHLLKQECGGAWQSYVQRGHWRIMYPFSRHQQENMSAKLVQEIRNNRPPVVHLVRFPQLTINHAILLFDATETDRQIIFTAYDPNKPDHPAQLIYDRATRTFDFPANDYFLGGRVDVYEVYQGWCY